MQQYKSWFKIITNYVTDKQIVKIPNKNSQITGQGL